MPAPQKGSKTILLRFGGGMNSRASEADIDDQECASGYNFDLDVANRELRPRQPIRYLGLAPNELPIQGFATFRDTAGNVTLLVQAGSTVYEYLATGQFVSRGTCSASAKLRGRLEHISEIDGVVLITDLALIEPVKQWDGTTLADTTFNNETAAAFGVFRAKYCAIDNERAIFANVYSNGTTTPNLIVGSKRGDYTTVSVANRPSSSLGDEDPFFLVQPDNGSINGMAKAFGILAFSSQFGDIYRLSGSSAQDFQMVGLFPRSGVRGDEALVGVGSDIHFGRQGRIQGLVATASYGDVESEDVSLPISNQIEDVASWTAAYNSRLQRAYWLPADDDVFYVYHSSFKPPVKPQIDQIADALSGGSKSPKLSPWVPWTIDQSAGGVVHPTCMMPVLLPEDGLEYIAVGFEDGTVALLEGFYGQTGTTYYGETFLGGDFGAARDITCSRLSKRFQLDSDAAAFNLQGWISYRKGDAFQVVITLEASGENIFDQEITIDVPASTGGNYYGGTSYYGGSFYYGINFRQRVSRQRFALAGKANEIQVRVSVTTEDTFWRLEEIGIILDEAS